MMLSVTSLRVACRESQTFWFYVHFSSSWR